MQNLLLKSEFLNRLRTEKRRVDRSKAPLSLVLFYFREKGESSRDAVQKFLTTLEKNTRESDIKGWVDEGVIGLILPDTDKNGTNHCVEKIDNGNGNIDYTIVTGTYPSDVIQKLLKLYNLGLARHRNGSAPPPLSFLK